MEKTLEDYLYQHIPLSCALGIHVDLASSQKVILSAPFANNINHKKTVFGGSLHAVATLTCWSLLYINLKKASEAPVEIVIAKSDVSYLAPVISDFKVECLIPDHTTWQHFLKTLHSKGKARIHLSATIHQQDRLCVDYQAVFVAIRR